MEMLIFLNGALFVCNLMLLLHVVKKPKTEMQIEAKADAKRNTTQQQWDNLLSYNGEAQGVSEHED